MRQRRDEERSKLGALCHRQVTEVPIRHDAIDCGAALRICAHHGPWIDERCARLAGDRSQNVADCSLPGQCRRLGHDLGTARGQ